MIVLRIDNSIMVERKILETDKNAVESTVKSLLENIVVQDKVEIQFPSGGKLYKSSLPDGKVYLRPMTFDDEKAVVGIKNPSDSLNTLLGRCLLGVNVDDLIATDKYYLVVKLRAISISPTYDFNIPCTNQSCLKINTISLNLEEDLPIVYADPPIEATKELLLPKANKRVVVKVLRESDTKGLTEVQLLDKLWRSVVSVEEFTNSKVISDFVAALPRKDVFTILKAATSKESGIQPRFLMQCDHCGSQSEQLLVLNEDFFSET